MLTVFSFLHIFALWRQWLTLLLVFHTNSIILNHYLPLLLIGFSSGGVRVYLGTICSFGKNGIPEEALLNHEEYKDDAVFG